MLTSALLLYCLSFTEGIFRAHLLELEKENSQANGVSQTVLVYVAALGSVCSLYFHFQFYFLRLSPTSSQQSKRKTGKQLLFKTGILFSSLEFNLSIPFVNGATDTVHTASKMSSVGMVNSGMVCVT